MPNCLNNNNRRLERAASAGQAQAEPARTASDGLRHASSEGDPAGLTTDGLALPLKALEDEEGQRHEVFAEMVPNPFGEG